MQDKVLIILPKLETYEFKPADDKLHTRAVTRKFFEWATSFNCIPYMIAEDELAYELFNKEKEIKWISTLSKVDSIFLITYSDIYDKYKENSKNKYRTSHIQMSKVAIGTPKDEYGDNNEVYLSTLHKAILKRIRLVSMLYVDGFDFVIQFSKSSNYTKKYTPKLGDGKIYIYYDLETDLVEYHYAGVELELNDIETILKEAD